MKHWFIAFILISIFAPCGEASFDDRLSKLGEKHRKWLEEEVTYIISDVEREVFLDLETELEREAFIEAFWRKRDLNPTTLENEYREEHYQRLEYVNEFFGRDTFRPGWMTDRGRFYMLLGPPVETYDYTGFDEIYPAELWFYNNPELKQFGLPPFFYLLFFRRQGAGELELYSPTMDGPEKLLTGYQTVSGDFRRDVQLAYERLYSIDPELAHASISFRTDEGDVVQFLSPSFGTAALLDQIAEAPFYDLDTSYAEHFDIDRGLVESDYLFNYVPSWGVVNVLPGPGEGYYLHWMIEVDPQNIAMVKDDETGVLGTLFIITAEVAVRDDPDRRLIDLRRESSVNMTEAQAKTGIRLPFTYSGMMPVAPGSYDVRIILRNRACPGRDESRCRKSYTILESPIEVPEWEVGRPSLSEIVLAHGLERPSGEPVYRPYRFGNVQLVANPRRIYALDEAVVVMVEPLHLDSDLRVRFRIFDRDNPERAQLEKDVPVEKFRLEPIVQEFSLEGFVAGRYRLDVDLVDPQDSVLASRTTDFDVSPRTAVPRPSVHAYWPMIHPEVAGTRDMALGEQYLRLGRKEEAKALFEDSIAANPQLGLARESLASLLMQDGETGRVIELLEPMYRQDRNRYEVLVLLGEAYFARKNYAKVAELLERAFALRPPDARLLSFLALSQYNLDNLDRARELANRSLALNPDQPEMKELLEKLR